MINLKKTYNTNKQIRFKASILRSDLCGYSDAYIVVKGDITVIIPNNINQCDKKLAFKNNAPFISYISKINNTLINNAEDLYIVMPKYNLNEYNKNYRKVTGNLWSYYRDEPNSATSGGINYCLEGSESFNYKDSITGKLEGKNLVKKRS